MYPMNAEAVIAQTDFRFNFIVEYRKMAVGQMSSAQLCAAFYSCPTNARL